MQNNTRSYFKFCIPFLIFIGLFAFLWRSLQLHPRVIPSPLINKPMPHFHLPLLLHKKGAYTDNTLSGKVRIVNVWASWCGACRYEHPFLMQLSKKYHIPIIGFDYKDRREDAQAYIQQLGDPYNLIGFDPKGQAAMDWGVYGVPETFLIDKAGLIRLKHAGPITPDVWQETFMPLIQRLEKEKG